MQEHTLKVLQGASSANPVPPALLKKDLFAIEATSTSQEAIYQIDITEGNINLELVVYEDSRENALNELNLVFTKLMEKFKEDWNLDDI